MADEGEVLTNLDADPAANGNGADTQPVAGILSQYVKDLSVENPKAPDSFQWTEQPQLDVQFNIGARQVNEEVSEIELKISVTAKTAQGTAVHRRARLLRSRRHAQHERRPQARLHLRRSAADPVPVRPPRGRRRGCATPASAPLMLDPIDFNGLYVQQLQQQQAAGSETPIMDGRGLTQARLSGGHGR